MQHLLNVGNLQQRYWKERFLASIYLHKATARQFGLWWNLRKINMKLAGLKVNPPVLRLFQL